jgi:hypothetical protein
MIGPVVGVKEARRTELPFLLSPTDSPGTYSQPRHSSPGFVDHAMFDPRASEPEFIGHIQRGERF